MKILFCDLCNESVPQSDIDQGAAIERKGRIICQSCDRAMSHSNERETAPRANQSAAASEVAFADRAFETVELDALAGAPPPAPIALAAPPRTSAAALWIAVLALLVAAGAIVMLDARTRALAARHELQAVAWDERTRAHEALGKRTSAIERAHAELAQATREDVAAARASLEELLGRERSDTSARASETAALAESVAQLRAEMTALREDGDRRLSELAASLRRNEEDQRLLVERFSTLETGPQVESAPVSDGSGEGARAPAWNALLADLSSANAGIRWQAVVGLGDTKDPLVVPSLLPMLADKDVFVRMATARILGDLAASAAVPALIDALEDAEAPVREASSIALRTITGKDLRFDPLGNEADRAKKVKAWRDWWKKLQDDSTAAPD